MVKVTGALILMVAALASSVAYADDKVEGRAIEALKVASDKFSERLEKIKNGGSEHAGYMSQRSNYNVGVSESSDLYVVVFVPSNRNIIGGGVEYRISKISMKIVKVVGYE